MKDELGTRMKEFYENRTRYFLPRRTYTMLRCDGKAFHSYTKGCEKPFDMGLIEDMNNTAIYLCENIQGAKLGFVQSDEISILMTDFDTIKTDAWFDGNIQKIVSVAASMATAKFNQLRQLRYIKEKFDNNITNITHRWMELLEEKKLAEFDARVFIIPSKTEVMNSLIWRQKDCVRNSIQSVAQSLYSHKELNNKNTNQMQEMIWQKGINWNDYDSTLKRGRLIIKEQYEKVISNKLPENMPPVDSFETVVRTRWIVHGCPDFVKHPEFLNLYVPDISYK